MDGIINILKPQGMTSFDVVAYMRGLLKTKKIGHTGTLDPDAVGVLPICTGIATKAIEFMMEKDKTYRAEMTLGISTDTLDWSGAILQTLDVSVSKEQIHTAGKGFIGEYNQLPPMYSAIKKDGVKLYELARQGIDIERETRLVNIYSLEVLDVQNDLAYINSETDKNVPVRICRVLIEVKCSKGTFIRTLCEDIGKVLGVPAHMSFLIRTQAGAYALEQAVTLEKLAQFAAEGRLAEAILNIDTAFEQLEEIHLDTDSYRKYRNGIHLKLDKTVNSGQLFKIYDENGDFTGIGETFNDKQDKFLKSRKFFKT